MHAKPSPMLLDTNVISELRKLQYGRAHPAVAQWAKRIDPAQTYISVVTLLELEYGVALLERRDPVQALALRNWLHGQVVPQYAGRTLDITAPIALRSAHLHVPDPRPERDAFIAATALELGLAVVTRNVKDFAPMGVRVLNPWDDAVAPAKPRGGA
jgi:toxin FitB